jgi:tRNA-guanine family transglycosylase
MKKAIYIPAYSDGLMSMFYGKDDNEIAKENQEDFSDKKSLRIYNKDFDSYFHNPYILISAGSVYKKTDFRKTIHAEKSIVFVDSGGYNLAHSTLDPKRFTDKIALEFSEANGDIFPILDRPTFTLGMMKPDGVTPVSPYKDYNECLNLSVNSAKYYYENRSRSDATILNVIQGQTVNQIESWYKEISKYEFEGWAYGGTKGNLGRILPALKFLLNSGELARESCKMFHIFGVTSNESMIYFQYLQLVFERMGIDLQITYDSTYWNRTCVFGSYMTRPRYIVGLGMEAMNWTNSINYKELSKDFKLPCHCPICEDLDDAYGFFNNYKIEDGEEVIVFKKFNNMIAFHNLYLQLEYLENVRRIFSSGMKDVYEAFFPQKICDNFKLIDDYFNSIDSDKYDALLNKKFLSGYIDKEKNKIIKDSKGSEACGLGI